MGALFSVLLIGLLAFYGGMELILLLQSGNSIITTNEVDSYYDSFYEFKLDKGNSGIQIAFGLTAYDGNFESLY